MMTLHEDAAREIPSRGVRVDPAHGVLHILRLLVERKKFVDAVELRSLVVDHAADDRSQPYLRPANDARQPEPANRRAEVIGILRWRAEAARAVRAHQLKPHDMTAERAGVVVVLAVDVVGDRAAERDVFRPRSDGEKEAA